MVTKIIHSADYYEGQRDAFRALAGMESTVEPGMLDWACAEARLAERAMVAAARSEPHPSLHMLWRRSQETRHPE